MEFLISQEFTEMMWQSLIRNDSISEGCHSHCKLKDCPVWEYRTRAFDIHLFSNNMVKVSTISNPARCHFWIFTFKKVEENRKTIFSYQLLWQHVVYTLKMPASWFNIVLMWISKYIHKQGNQSLSKTTNNGGWY